MDIADEDQGDDVFVIDADILVGHEDLTVMKKKRVMMILKEWKTLITE